MPLRSEHNTTLLSVHVWKSISLASWSEEEGKEKTEPAKKIESSLLHSQWAQYSYRAKERERRAVKEGRRRTERRRNFDLFIAASNQLQTHWTALTLSFCPTSSWEPLSSSHLLGILNLDKRKFLPPHSETKREASSLNWKRGQMNLFAPLCNFFILIHSRSQKVKVKTEITSTSKSFIMCRIICDSTTWMVHC